MLPAIPAAPIVVSLPVPWLLSWLAAAKLPPPTHMDNDLKLPPPHLRHLKGRHRDGAVGLLEGLMQLEGDLGGAGGATWVGSRQGRGTTGWSR